METVTEPEARSPVFLPLSWLALLSSYTVAETAVFFERRPHLRGVPAKSPLLTDRVATSGSPDAPLGFFDSELSLVDPLATLSTEVLATLFEAQTGWDSPDCEPAEANAQYQRPRRP